MEDKISKLVNKFIDDRNAVCLYLYNEVDDVEASLEEELMKLFEENGVSTSDYSIDRDILFSCPSCDIGYLSIAAIVNGTLIHQCYQTN